MTEFQFKRKRNKEMKIVKVYILMENRSQGILCQ